MALNNVQFLVPVDGGVSKLQAVLPPAAWYVHTLYGCHCVKTEADVENMMNSTKCVIFIQIPN